MTEHPRTRMVHDFRGDLVAITPGVCDDNAHWVYVHGQCLALAVAISEHTGWPVHLRTFAEGDTADPVGTDPSLRHAYVQTPDETLLDIRGAHDADIVDEECRDFDGDRYLPPRIVPADQARALLDEWADRLEPQDLTTAATLVHAVLAAADADSAA